MIIIILVLPLNIIAITYANEARRTIIEQAEFSSQRLADYHMQQLESEMEAARVLLTFFLNQDTDFQKMKNMALYGYEYESVKLKFYYRLQKMAETVSGVDGYYYYFPKRQDGVVYGNSDGEQRLVKTLWKMLADYEKEKYPSGWHIYEWEGQRYLIFLSADTKIVYGAAIRLEDFLNDIKESIAYPNAVISLAEQETETENPESIVMKAAARGIHLTIEIEKPDVLKRITFPQKALFGMSFSYLLLIPALYLLLQRLLIRPLLRIDEAHRQIEQGNGEYRLKEFPDTTELLQISLSFNKMADNLARLKIESYEKELSRQKMELQNLQLQIRPHFLLNTFNLIFTLSQKKENEEIQRTVIYLSDYFRYIFREEKELELFPKELKLIQGYAAMASVRYFGRVKMEYELDKKLDFVRLPPLLIHNFIENAVKYGIKKNEILHICLEGHYQDGMVLFRIRDDGKGMTEEILTRNQSLLCGAWEPEKQTEHLGLYNSMRRLRYFYGEEARIDVFSRLGEGTCFEIQFPYSGIE